MNKVQAFKEYNEQVLDELEKLAIAELIQAYQPPIGSVAQFITKLAFYGYISNTPPARCAKITYDRFVEIANRVKAN